MNRNLAFCLAAPASLLLIGPASLAQQPAPKPPARHASMPVATRDGQRIAFWSERDGHAQIYTMKADGTDVRRLTGSPRTDLGADWSPDGQWLVFASYAEGSDLGEITRIRADGTDRRTLARGKDARWPRVSSDGKKIAFTQEDEHGMDGVYVMDADGANLKAFPTGLEKSWEPAWSPDGRHLLFSQPPANFKDLAAAKTTIYVAEISGSQPPPGRRGSRSPPDPALVARRPQGGLPGLQRPRLEKTRTSSSSTSPPER